MCKQLIVTNRKNTMIEKVSKTIRLLKSKPLSILNQTLSMIKRHKAKRSYSQCGEDLIVDFVFNDLKINDPTYVDIGAHHPKYLSNTHFFYTKGCHGICIEPDPYLFKKIKKQRTRDICLNLGIGINQEKSADLYIMTTRTLNTFSKSEAERYQSYGSEKIEKTIKMPLENINDIINRHCKIKPNFISLDIEGLDFDIIKTFDFSTCKPEVFCIETITYTENKTEEKIESIIDFMKNKNYFVYADTYINTIFVNIDSWKNRPL
jgi:FkbM family methyltransferase